MSSLYAWLRRHPLLVDGVLAAVLALLSLAEMVRQPWPQVLVTLLMTAPIAVRRRIPVAAFGIVALGGLIQVALAQPSAADVAVLVLIYTVAAYRPRRYSLITLPTALIGSVFAVLAWAPFRNASLLGQALAAAVLFGGSALISWVLGDSMHYRRGYYAALEDRAARLEAERHAEARIAAAAERARIARELHDVVAHHVSVMVVQADGAGYAMRSDPDRAEAALKAISRTGRQALSERRRLLGVLRSTAEEAELAPVPGLGELRELLDQARAAGLEVSYTLSGPPRELSEGAELAAYRMVQESLTNTRKHAGLAATAAVALRYEPEGLTVEVTDDGLGILAGGPDTTGHGLAGMRERIAMYGGTVEAGPRPGGGFRVVAHLPCPQGPESVRPDLAGAGSADADPNCAGSNGAGPRSVGSGALTALRGAR